MSESRSSPTLYTAVQEQQQQQQQQILPPPQPQPQPQQQQQQRVHVIKKNIYLMASASGGNGGPSSGGGNTISMVNLLKKFYTPISTKSSNRQIFSNNQPFSYLFQVNNLNRQIIMQPKSIVAGNGSVNGSQTATNVSGTENTEEVQYFSRASKKLNTQGANNATTSNLVDNVNVVFRAPVVSSSSNQSMRPPPPPPPKIKGHSEEPSSSIPDLGEFHFLSFQTI